MDNAAVLLPSANQGKGRVCTVKTFAAANA